MNKVAKEMKQKRNRKKGDRERVTWRPTGPPAGPAQPPLQRAAWLGHARKQVLDVGRSTHDAAARRPASSPRRAAALDRSHTPPPSSQTRPLLPSSSPSLSRTMADDAAPAPP